MRRDQLLLGEMIEAADRAHQLTGGVSVEELEPTDPNFPAHPRPNELEPRHQGASSRGIQTVPLVGATSAWRLSGK
jgi:hypothetical protein